MWLITTIKSWFKKEPEKPKPLVYGVDYTFQQPPKIVENRTILMPRHKIEKSADQLQYEKNKADQAKIQYKPEIKTQPGSLPVRDVLAKHRHEVPHNQHWISENKVVEYLDYVEENDDDRLREQAESNTFMGSSEDSPN